MPRGPFLCYGGYDYNVTYKETLSTHMGALAQLKLAKEFISTDHALKPIDWSEEEDNKRFLAFLQKEKIVSGRDIAQARQRAKVIATLAAFPANAPDYIDILVKLSAVEVAYSGVMSRIDPNSGKRRDLIVTDFARDARIMAAGLKLPISRDEINDAVDAWYPEAKRARLTAIRQMVAPRASFDWIALARDCFDCSDTSPQFVAAVLQKFVHQVLCKLHDKPVEHHLMPVLTGPQGKGKTYFIHRLIGQLRELSRAVDFGIISDDRNIEVWSSFILVLDEMAHAARADVETVKNVITADYLDRRPMRTNNIVHVRQCATMIAGSNKDVGELIRDDTGSRRFVGIEYAGAPSTDYLDGIDWRAAWKSIKHTDADPLEAFRDTLKAVQADTRHLSPVEDWLRTFNDVEARDMIRQHGALRPAALYNHYLSHRAIVTADRDPFSRTLDQFVREMARLHRDPAYDSPMMKARDGTGVVYKWKAPLPPMLLVGGNGK